MVTVYRVAHPSTRKGPYNSYPMDMLVCDMLGRHSDIDSNQPAPHRDGLDDAWSHGDKVYGFASFAALRDWFGDPDDVEALASGGFVVSSAEVPDNEVERGRCQVRVPEMYFSKLRNAIPVIEAMQP